MWARQERPRSVDVPAKIVITKDEAIASFIPSFLSIKGRTEARAPKHLVIAGILDHLGTNRARKHGNRVVKDAFLIEQFAIGIAARQALIVIVGIHVRSQKELADVAQAT